MSNEVGIKKKSNFALKKTVRSFRIKKQDNRDYFIERRRLMARITAVLLAIFVIILAGCETPPATQDSDEQAIVEQNPKAQLLAELDKTYENPEAHYQLGRLYYAEGALDKAEYSYKIAIGFRPAHYRAQAGLVKIAVQIIAELYISQTAVSAQGSLRLGKAFQNEGLGEYAVSCYYQAIGLDPESPEPYKLLGYYYLDEGDKVRAEENLRRSFELNPYQPEVSGELGRIGITVQTPRHSNIVNTPESQD
jgi:tetratricopeptide (TPR) repeat protein